MPDIIIDTTRLLSRIILSHELTALEKRYLENLIVRAMECEPEESSLPQTFRDSLLDKFSKRR